MSNNSSLSSGGSSDSNDATFNLGQLLSGAGGGGSGANRIRQGLLKTFLSGSNRGGPPSESLGKFTAILRAYDEQKTQAGFDPTPVLTQLAEIIEKVRTEML